MNDKLQWRPFSEADPEKHPWIVVIHDESDEPFVLMWKSNHRILDSLFRGEVPVERYKMSYYGDPYESDDYSLARPGGEPKWFIPLPLPAWPTRWSDVKRCADQAVADTERRHGRDRLRHVQPGDGEWEGD